MLALLDARHVMLTLSDTVRDMVETSMAASAGNAQGTPATTTTTTTTLSHASCVRVHQTPAPKGTPPSLTIPDPWGEEDGGTCTDALTSRAYALWLRRLRALLVDEEAEDRVL
jgi:hypothetical protein